MASTTRTRQRPATTTPRNGTKLSPEPRYAKLGEEVQRFDALRSLPIGLSDEVRSESCELLNGVLADTSILYALYKKHHWLVVGPTFYQLHLLFDKHADEQLELVDLLAERVQSLGGIAVGDPRHVAELTSIERPPDGAEDVPAMITRLLKAHQIVINGTREAIERT
ncbi:MAG: DNA starvation/stationary phase protection protein, partial [Chloroflexi bacterium 13_1_40CM_4_68_4]